MNSIEGSQRLSCLPLGGEPGREHRTDEVLGFAAPPAIHAM